MKEDTLPNDVAELKTIIVEQLTLIQNLQQSLVQLNQQLAWFQRHFYGQQSERQKRTQKSSTPTEEQQACSLTNATEKSSQPLASHGRRVLPEALPREKCKLDLPDEQKYCRCGGKLHCIGKDISEQLEFIPARLYVKQWIRYKYGCNHCKGPVVMPPLPPQPIEKGLAGPGLLAEVIVSKYADSLPLYRQEKRWERLGYVIPRTTQCDWVMQSARLLKPLVDLMQADLLKSKKIHTDDTSFPVLAPQKTHVGRLWVYVGGGEHTPACTIYEYTATRKKEGPKRFLENYRGFLQADAYGGYDHLYSSGAIIEVACWAHARRKFVDVVEYYKTETAAETVLQGIRTLYAIEERLKHHSSQARYYQRRREAKPVLKKLLRYIKHRKKTIVPNSLLDKAFDYTLNHWRALGNYLRHGELSIDNNTAERAIRPVVLGRKNYLFAGSESGAAAAAILYSLITTCKQNHINCFDYFSDVLTRLPSALNKDLHTFLPYHWEKYRP